MASSLFTLRGKLSTRQSILLSSIGVTLILVIWYILSSMMTETNIRPLPQSEATAMTDKKYFENDSLRSAEFDQLLQLSDADLAKYGLAKTETMSLLPSPTQVGTAFVELFNRPVDRTDPNDKRSYLVYHTLNSLWLNFLGYLLAIGISLPIGFTLGLIPLFRGLFSKVFDALRFIPLAAATGIFIAWFGLESGMKVTFLAFGIIVYLVPVVVQRVDVVESVYLKTVFTLGASRRQTIRTVYLPAVMSRIFDDIRVLTAISWTYITIAEMLNNTGGLGSMIFYARRQGRVDHAFAVLVLIVLIGIIQDRIFVFLDKILFPHKHIQKHKK